MDSRQKESNLLAKCVLASKAQEVSLSMEEASVVLLASKLLRQSIPSAANQLNVAAAAYFSTAKHLPLKGEELVRARVISGLPRLRSMLEQLLRN